jgi:hypothetical protein
MDELLKKHQEMIDRWYQRWLEEFKKEVDRKWRIKSGQE